MPAWMLDVGMTSGSVQFAAAWAADGPTGEDAPPGASAINGRPAAARISAPRRARTAGVERTRINFPLGEPRTAMVRLTIRCTTGLQIGQRGLLGQVTGVVVGDQRGNPGCGVEQLRDAAVGAADETPSIVTGESGRVAGAGPHRTAVGDRHDRAGPV